jgi:hypothetical protein
MLASIKQHVLTRFCARHVDAGSPFPSAPALRSTDSAAATDFGSALFAGFTATMARLDFPRPCIIGYGSSPSRCGPGRHLCLWSDAGSPSFRRAPSTRDVLFDPGRAAAPRISVLLILRSTTETVSAPATSPFRGSITHPMQQLCTLRGRRYLRLTQHSPPGSLLGLTWAGLSPAERASLLAPSSIRATIMPPQPRRPGGRARQRGGRDIRRCRECRSPCRRAESSYPRAISARSAS